MLDFRQKAETILVQSESREILSALSTTTIAISAYLSIRRLERGFICLQRFTQYGVIKPGEDGAPKVKLYRDKATNMPKGDGLVTFLYEPSVSHSGQFLAAVSLRVLHRAYYW